MNILRLQTVLTMTGLSRSTLWRLEAAGDFPRRLKLGTHAMGWLEPEILAWIASRSRGGPAPIETIAAGQTADVNAAV